MEKLGNNQPNNIPFRIHSYPLSLLGPFSTRTDPAFGAHSAPCLDKTLDGDDVINTIGKLVELEHLLYLNMK